MGEAVPQRDWPQFEVLHWRWRAPQEEGTCLWSRPPPASPPFLTLRRHWPSGPIFFSSGETDFPKRFLTFGDVDIRDFWHLRVSQPKGLGLILTRGWQLQQRGPMNLGDEAPSFYRARNSVPGKAGLPTRTRKRSQTSATTHSPGTCFLEGRSAVKWNEKIDCAEGNI